MKTTLVGAVVATLAMFAACSDEPEVKSKQWYVEHPTERAAMLNRCKNLAADASKDANCVNATGASLIDLKEEMK